MGPVREAKEIRFIAVVVFQRKERVQLFDADNYAFTKPATQYCIRATLCAHPRVVTDHLLNAKKGYTRH